MGTSTFWQKDLSCPVCSTKVTVQKVRQGSYEVEKRDPDFCVWYKGVNPVFYSVHVCPSCNYASTAEEFDKLDRRTAQRFQGEYKIGSGTDEFSGLISPELAIKAHLLAIDTFKKLPGSEGKIAGLYLRVAWICRQKGEQEEETKYLQMSIDNYKTAFETARKLPEKLGEIGVAYLIGELSRRLGDKKEAIRWFNVALSNKGIKMRPDLEKLARAQWQATREGFQEEHKIASMGVPFGKLSLNPDQLKDIANYMLKYSVDDFEPVKEFERAFAAHAGVKFAVAFNHRYFAYESLISALDIGPGDELIIPAFSPLNLITILKRTGAVVKFADISENKLSASVESIKSNKTPQTKAIFVERFAGNDLDIKDLKYAANIQVPIVQLAYESLSSKSVIANDSSSTLATIYDLSQLTSITALNGAVVSTSDKNIVDKIKQHMNHPSIAEYTFNGIASDVASTGYDYQLNSLNAKIAILAAKDFDNIIDKQAKVHAAYRLAFDKSVKEGKVVMLSGNIAYGSFALKLNGRETVEKVLASAKESHVYLHKMPVPACKNVDSSTTCPNAENIFSQALLLPAFPSMTQMDVERIATIIISAID